MILGISGSGRKDKITEKAVKAVLEASGEEYEFISLSGKRINGCTGCTGCAKNDNRCIIQDDWKEIEGKMLEADAIVFGAPNYYGMINSLAHACLERTFAFRHESKFSLAGKLGVSISVGYNASEKDSVNEAIQMFMSRNYMPIVRSFSVKGYSQCFTCGKGIGCASGQIVGQFGYIEEVEEEHLPKGFELQEEAQLEARKAGEVLGAILKNKKKTYEK